MTMARVPTNPKGNQRDRILDILRDRSNERGYVKDVDVELLARLTEIDDHDVAKQLWGMQKAGLIGFSVKKGHGQSWPYRFRLRKAIMGDTQTEQASALLGDRAAHAVTNPTRRAHSVGPDLLDPTTARQRQLAESSGVTTRRHSPPEVTGRLTPAEKDRAGTETPKAIETPKKAVPVEEYPLITELLDRKARYHKVFVAAKALEAAGLQDLADQAWDTVPDPTPLEQEIIRWFEKE